MTNNDLCDSVTMIVTDDNNFLCLVSPEEACMVSFMTSRIPPSSQWRDVINRDLGEILRQNVRSVNSVHRIVKIWMPGPTNHAHIVNIVVLVRVSAEFKNIFLMPTSCRFNNLKWLTDRELHRFYQLHAVDSPMLIEFLSRIRHDTVRVVSCPSGYTDFGNFAELTEEALKRPTGNTIVDRMLDEVPAKINLIALYLKYLKRIFPNIFMAAGHFARFAVEIGYSKDEGLQLFRAADLTGRHFISFREFFAITIAMDPTTKHTGPSRKARAFYIFRYVNQTSDAKLNLRELRDMIMRYRRGQQMPIDNIRVEKDVKDTALILNMTPTHSLTCYEFMIASEDSRMQWLSKMMRCKYSWILQSLRISSKSNTLLPHAFHFVTKNALSSLKALAKWDLASHVTHVQNDGDIILINTIFEKNIGSPSKLMSGGITKLNRKVSLDRLSKEHVCNELLDCMRELARVNDIQGGNRGNKSDYNWGVINANTVAQKICHASELCKEILSREDRLLKIISPTYILGDFHGNFGDLLCFEKMFWPITPINNPARTLFLGDYVDRGWFSMEVATYLICHKVLYPNKFFLVRGNHEIRSVQQMYTFPTECNIKFGETNGKLVWEAINVVFDFMPIAAIIDDKIFCCHGGIPPPWLCPTIAAINLVPRPLPDPDVKSPLAWDLLWNDPIKDQLIEKEMMVEMNANDGFATNIKRGTAHLFSNFATKRFLEKNKLSHIIRAHEMAFTGFNVFHEGKVITVFSSSKYNNSVNEAASIMIDNYKLQPIRMDSESQEPPSFCAGSDSTLHQPSSTSSMMITRQSF